MINQRVDVLPVGNDELLDQLISGNISSNEIKTFSTSDNVFELLALGENGTFKIASCKQSSATGKDDKQDIYCDAYTRMSCKIVYQKAGIYFALVGKAQNQRRFAGVWFSFSSSLSYQQYAGYKPKCRDQEDNFDPGYVYWNDIYSRPYESTRGLNKYLFEIYFSNPLVTSRKLSIQDNW